jgi:hypothetical protein
MCFFVSLPLPLRKIPDAPPNSGSGNPSVDRQLAVHLSALLLGSVDQDQVVHPAAAITFSNLGLACFRLGWPVRVVSYLYVLASRTLLNTVIVCVFD